MDYKAFYEDVVDWIQRVNQAASQHGMGSESFWAFIAQSCGEMCAKYQDNRLVIKQMMMMAEWIEEVYESQQVSKS